MAGTIRVEHDDTRRIATVVISQPERRNAISRAMWETLLATFQGFLREEAEGLRAIVIRGAREGNAFCPGADVTEFPAQRGTTEQALTYKARTHQTLEAVAACPCPVIAAIDGPCVGAGLEIAMAADIRLAADRSTFSLPVVRLSNTADLHDIQRLVQVVGPGLAAEMLYSAASVAADRLYAAGALSWHGPAEELDSALDLVVGRIAAAAPRAVRLAKVGLRMVQHHGEYDEAIYREGVREVLSGHDFEEGTRAFMEKRPPQFHGV